MIRFGFGILSSLCLLVCGILLWSSPVFHEGLPGSLSALIAAYFDLFRNPVSGGVILAGCALLIMFAQCVTEILLGLVFSASALAASFLCLIGFLGARFPAMADFLEKLFR